MKADIKRNMSKPTFDQSLKGMRGTSDLRCCTRRFLNLFLLVFFFWFCIFISKAESDTLRTDINQQMGELSKIRKELIEKRKTMERLNQKERGAFAEFLDLEERIELTERLIKRLAFKEKSIAEELRTKERILKETDLKLCSRDEHLHRRLRETYKHKRFSSYALMFQASSPLDLINRLRFAKRILLEDQKMLKGTQTLKANLEEKRQNLSKAKAELSWLKGKKSEEQRTYQKDLKEKERWLKKIESEKKLYAQSIGELEESVFEMHQILGRLQKEKRYDMAGEFEGNSWFETLRGKLPWPTKGRVISSFGEQIHPRFHTKTKNPGIEIEAEPGKEIVAVAKGRVVYSSRLRGYGNFLILEHEEGYYTLYACLSEILVSPSEEVERLQKIGVVSEGELISAPRLHFEIRKGREPQDPLEWLK